jgi:ribose 5-phosphate isomerase B
MTIAIGSDHAGFAYKALLQREIEALGHTIADLGTHGQDSVDYPGIAAGVGRAVRDGRADLGLFLCGTGIGGAIAANKVHGVRAALCHEAYTARMSREHNNANVLCIGARVIGEELAVEILRVWLATPFTGADRHARRIAQIDEVETDHGVPPPSDL